MKLTKKDFFPNRKDRPYSGGDKIAGKDFQHAFKPFYTMKKISSIIGVILVFVFMNLHSSFGMEMKSISTSSNSNSHNAEIDPSHYTGIADTLFYLSSNIVFNGEAHPALTGFSPRTNFTIPLKKTLVSNKQFSDPGKSESVKEADVFPPIEIMGTVIDSITGEPLAGVTVRVKGTGTGTVTDGNGRFSLEAEEDAILEVSFVGYDSQNIAVDGRDSIRISLSSGTTGLDQIVVTALGIERKEESLGYSIAKIESSDIDKVREVNVINSIQGKVAGVTISMNDNGVGGQSKVLLRGNRSITGNNQPLYVVDGVPLGGDIGMLNTSDIESMNVLKGAAAAALYGSQGQNGAIIIETKKAKAGKLSVRFNGGLTFETPMILPERQYEYGQGDGGKYVANSEHSWGPKAEGQMVELWNGHEVPLRGQRDQLKRFFRTGKTLTNNIILSGGSEKMRSYFSYGNVRQTGLVRNNDLTKHNVDFKVNINPTSKLSVFSKISYAYEEINNNFEGQTSNTGGMETIGSAFGTPTSIPVEDLRNYTYLDEDGIEKQNYWKPGSSILSNPYWALNRMLHVGARDRIMGLVQARYEFTSWLDLQVRASIDKTLGETEFDVWEDNYQSLVGSTVNIGRTNSQITNADVLLSFTKDLSDNLNLSLNGGGSIQTGKYSSLKAEANGLYRANFFYLNNAKDELTVKNPDGKNPLVQSLYGTATFDFKNMLYLDGTIRNDWSSALPKANNSYFYPSVGLSGIISRIFDLPEWVRYGKVRLSYAESGFGGEEYLNQNYYSIGTGGQIIPSTIQSLNDYKPELTSSYEVGLDWQFLRNERIGFDATYYRTDTKNQLLLIGAPPESLFEEKYINAGLIRNQGFEFGINFKPVQTQDFNWEGYLTFSTNRNKVIRLTDEISTAVLNSPTHPTARIVAKTGQRFGDLYVKAWEKDEEGRLLVDEEGMPILTDGTTTLLGNYNPDFMLGFNNTLSFKEFTLGFLIDYRKGGYVVSRTQALLDAAGHSKASLEGREGGMILDAYTENGKKNNASVDPEKFFNMIGGGYPTGTYYGYSRTNIRMREAYLSYSLPRKIINRIGFIENASLSLIGRNLFFFKVNTPFDPEVTSGLGGDGLEGEGFPSARSVGVNLNISF